MNEEFENDIKQMSEMIIGLVHKYGLHYITANVFDYVDEDELCCCTSYQAFTDLKNDVIKDCYHIVKK